MTNAKPPILTVVIPNTDAVGIKKQIHKDLDVSIWTIGLSTKIQGEKTPSGIVNSLRQQGIEASQSEWIWLLDLDCRISDDTLNQVLNLIKEAKEEIPTIVGGLYSSTSMQSCIQRSYNHMCNLWSLYHQIPIAGNLLINKNLLPKSFDLSPIQFGNEEHYITQVAFEHGLKTKIHPNLKVEHLNAKTLRSWLNTCSNQSSFRKKDSRAKLNQDFALLLKKSAAEDFSSTLLAIIYVALGRFFGLIRPKGTVPQSLKSAPNTLSPKSSPTNQSPHP